MMRLCRMNVLRSIEAQGVYHWVRGVAPLRNWLYKHQLIAYDEAKQGTVITEKGKASLTRALNEYASRPKHCQPRAWEIRLAQRQREMELEKATLVGPDGTKVVGLDEDAGIIRLHVHEEDKKNFKEAVERDEAGPLMTVIPVKSAQDAVELFREPEPRAPDWVPPKVEEPTVDLDKLAEEMNKAAAGDDELAAKRKEKEAKERAAELARQIEAQQDRMRKYVTEVRVLDAYREIAQEIGNLGQGVEDVYVGKLNGIPIQFNPFVPHDALVFHPNNEKPELIYVGYDVAKALLTQQPPNATAYPSMAALYEKLGTRCWRCCGTGNLSRNFTVNDQLCPQCKHTGWIK